jgi:hypothetical protein
MYLQETGWKGVDYLTPYSSERWSYEKRISRFVFYQTSGIRWPGYRLSASQEGLWPIQLFRCITRKLTHVHVSYLHKARYFLRNCLEKQPLLTSVRSGLLIYSRTGIFCRTGSTLLSSLCPPSPSAVPILIERRAAYTPFHSSCQRNPTGLQDVDNVAIVQDLVEC